MAKTMKPIHVCHISQSAGGVETYILSIINNTCNTKFIHTVICWKNGTLANNAKNDGARVILLPMVGYISPFKDFISFLRILYAVKNLKPDIIHAHSGKGGIFGRLIGMFLRIPTGFTPHAFSYLSFIGLRRILILTLEKLLACTPSVLIATSPSERKRAINEVGWKLNKKNTSFPNSIKVNNKTVKHIDNDIKKIIFIGRLSYQKNPEMFIRVAKIVTDQNDKIMFTLLGAGYADEMRNKIIKMIKDFGLESSVSLKPWVTLKAVEDILLDYDIYVSTSNYESFGYTTAESMSKALPVVGTMIDGTVDLVKHGETGYLVNIDDDERMAHYICSLAKDIELRKKFGLAGKRIIQEKFNIDKNIVVIEKIYNNLNTQMNQFS
jgi:glycosyltransferase involved in cell wall biosynthesis